MDDSVNLPLTQSSLQGALSNQPPPDQNPLPVPQPSKNTSFISRLFSGRLNRKGYIMGSFWVCLPLLVIYILFAITYGMMLSTLNLQDISNIDEYNPFFKTVTSALAISMLFSMPFTFLYNLSFSIKRLHDIGASGWLVWINLIFPLGLIICFIPGTKGENKYGREPQNSSLKQLLGFE